MLKSQNVIIEKRNAIFFQLKCMIQSITRNLILSLNLWEELTLYQACTNFGLISLGQEQSLWLSQSVYFVTTKGGQGQFLGESYPINVLP